MIHIFLRNLLAWLANPWGLVVIFVFLIFISNLPLLMISWLFGPRDRDPVRDAPFESGQAPIGPARRRFVMQYYPYLLIFVVLDVLAMFLFAWALAFLKVGLAGSIAAILLLAIVIPPTLYGLYLAEKREIW